MPTPKIMGVLNVTPDSFSDGGKLMKSEQEVDIQLAVNIALDMIDEGADMIDIGGEASGPTSKDVPLEDELARVIPVIKKLLEKKKDLFISVDTYKSEVARQALEAGAKMINDVTALRGDPKMAKVLAKHKAQVVLMYSKDATARTTRGYLQYENVLKTVAEFLQERIRFAIGQGIPRANLIVDPGMGAFVSTDPKYSLQILKHLEELKVFELPILIGASRKGFIGDLLNVEIEDRLEGSLACAAMAMLHGASILRVHDVLATRRMVNMIDLIERSA